MSDDSIVTVKDFESPAKTEVIESESGITIYEGFPRKNTTTDSTAGWAIRRTILPNTGAKTEEWSDGNTKKNDTWNSRASKTYKHIAKNLDTQSNWNFLFILRTFFSVLIGTERALKVTKIQKPKRIVTGQFTRPDNTTAYAINDVVGTSPAAIVELESVVSTVGGSGKVLQARLSKNGVSVTNAAFKLMCFKEAPTAIADNEPFQGLFADRSKLLFMIDFTMKTFGSGSDTAIDLSESIRYFKCADDSTSMYLVIVATAAYTPKTEEQFSVELLIEED